LDTYADLFDDDYDSVAVALNHVIARADVGKMRAKLESGSPLASGE